MLKHRDIRGTVEFDQESKMFFGELVGINGLVMYEAENAEDFNKNFISAVDDYIQMCEENEMPIKKEFKGVFNVRTTPEMHEKLFTASVEKGIKLNAIINEAFEVYFSKEKRDALSSDMAITSKGYTLVSPGKHAWYHNCQNEINEKIHVLFDSTDKNVWLECFNKENIDRHNLKSIKDKIIKDRLEKKK